MNLSVILSIIIGFVVMATAYELFTLGREYLEKNRDYLQSSSFILKSCIRGSLSSQKELVNEPIIPSILHFSKLFCLINDLNCEMN